MACKCNEDGKMINNGMGCCQPIVDNIDNYYTKSEVDEMISNLVREIETLKNG